MSIKFDFTGKVIALTGGASGIGLETARLLVASGAKVSIADVQKETLDGLVGKLGMDGPGEVLTTAVDVSDAGQVKDWIHRTVETFGKLDGAANLAGVTGKGLVKQTTEELEDDDWAFVISVNLTGVMYCMREQLRNMNNNGSLVNASSFAGIRGYAKNAPYVASKHGVVGLTRSAAKEVGPERNIRVNAIAP
jgi:NAD(P)-dependent dehydrogenase (short-subunit alcohol dehydrogenase family)